MIEPGLDLARLRRGGNAVAGALVSLLAALVCADVIARDPRPLRLVVAAVVCANLALLAIRAPRAGAVTTLLFLPFLALTRRLLLPYTPWVSTDPLLLVGPIIAIVVLWQTRLVRPGRDRLTRLLMAICLIGAIESLNPTGGTLRAGLTGFGVLMAPLLWFFVGRAVCDAVAARTALLGTLGIAGVVGLYGIFQTEQGLPMWDREWLQTAGYSALNVGGVTRAFGTFSSSSEYALYLAVGLTIALGLVLHGRLLALVPIPLLAVALFLDSDRGAIVLAVFAALVLLSLRAGRPRVAALTVVVGFGVIALAVHFYGPTLTQRGATAVNPLVSHQLTGLGDPLNSRVSTLPAHWSLVLGGIESGIRRPWGAGTATIGHVGAQFGATSGGTEVDFADAFHSLGLVGGVIYAAVMFLALKCVARLYFRRRDPLIFLAAAVLLTTFGSWLNGGYYALGPLVWFLIGWMTRVDLLEPEPS